MRVGCIFRTWYRWQLLLGLLLLAGAARAAEAPLSWNNCLGELIRNNPQLLAGREAVAKARADVSANYAPFLPQISAEATASRSKAETDAGYTEATSYQASLSAYQSLFAGFSDLATLRRSQALLSLAEINLLSTKAALSAQLRQSFARLLFAQDFVRLAELITARRKENVNLVEMRFEGGRENKGSFLRSAAYYRQAQFDVRQAARGLKAAQQELAATLGRREIAPLTVTGNWDQAALPATPDIRNLALETPDYRQAAEQARAAREGVAIARSVFYPTWSVQGSLSRSDDDKIIPQNDQWSVGTTLSYPLFVGGRHWYAARGAQAEQRQAEATLNDTLNQMAARLQERFAAWQDAAERLSVQTEFLKAAEVRAEIARAQYQNGLLSFVDWDLIENDLIERQKAVLASQLEAVVAEANWEKTLGTGVIP
ncbi:MAG: TolC family protein [Lentisphaerae bacterium]|nr:TolC family protein [Lentisphaerota bacterium]